MNTREGYSRVNTVSRSQALHRVREFVSVYRLYRNHHPAIYSARIAYGVVFRGLPF